MDTIRPLPKPLERLGPLAADLRLTGSKTLAHVWRRLDQDAWDRTNNPHVVLQHAHQERLAEAAADPTLVAELDRWFERQSHFTEGSGWFGGVEHDALTGIAYFSMEFGLSEALPIYSGGLGILAGDHLKSASDLGVPVIGIGLLYQQGYFRQVLAPDGWQLEAFPFNDPGSLPISPVLDADGRWPRIRLELPGRVLLLRVWQAVVGRVRLYLLDSNHPLNSPWDRGITANLYAAGRENRILQELVLGVGGWRLLDKIGLKAEVCHLNEGHAAFAVIARAASFAEQHKVPFAVALRATRAGNVFTTHTPVEAAFDRFDPELVLHYAGPLMAEAGLASRDFLAIGRRDPDDDAEPFNMAYLALRGSGHVNGVARLHGEVSRRLFAPLFRDWSVTDVPVSHVTNGVHVPTWHSETANRLWTDAYGSDKPWLGDVPGAADHVAALSDERLWDYRATARKVLIDYVRDRLVRQLSQRNVPADDLTAAAHALDPNVLTLGFARRFAAYKRPDLMLTDPDRFARLLADPDRPVQIIVAGKAHPDDQGAKQMIREFAQFAWRPDTRSRIVFLEDYDMVLAQQFATGIDVWINNPRRPAEACGTSGMKMLVNGGLHCSTLDGWWDEAYLPEAGWAIGGRIDHDGSGDADDAEALYDVLERAVVPEFYDRDHLGLPRSWIARVRASMSRLTPEYSSDRMVRDYVEGSYLPAARAFAERSNEACRVAIELEAWSSALAESWSTLRFGRLDVTSGDGAWIFEVQVFLGDVGADAVRLELFAVGPTQATARPMEPVGRIPGAVNGQVFRVVVPADRPADDFTPRAIPSHPAAFVPLESSQITWGPRPTAGLQVIGSPVLEDAGVSSPAPVVAAGVPSAAAGSAAAG